VSILIKKYKFIKKKQTTLIFFKKKKTKKKKKKEKREGKGWLEAGPPLVFLF